MTAVSSPFKILLDTEGELGAHSLEFFFFILATLIFGSTVGTPLR
jgi:hypothetical protein